MTKIFSSRFWIVLTSSCVIGTGIAWACSDGWGEEYGTSNFTPEVFVDSSYSPFFYSDMFYYKIGHDVKQNDRFNNANLNEWSGYFGNQAKREDLEFLLQQATLASIDSAVAFRNSKSAAPASLVRFNLLKQKNDKKAIAFFKYLQLAKKSEAFALNDGNSWDYDADKKKTKNFDATTLNRELQSEFSKTQDIFLKQRYWFQLIRSYFFNGNPQQVIELFNAYEKQMPVNKMYYRVLAYVAGAYYKNKDYGKANYYYSKVYDACDELKTTAHYSFHPQEEKDWRATLAMCRNQDEQATLWQMLGVFYADEKRAINEIYQLNPKSNKLSLLLSRAINKYESEIDMYLPRDTSAGNAELHQLINKIASAGNTEQPWIWLMAAGYLNSLDNNYEPAKSWLIKAEKIIPPAKLPQAQLRLLKLINKVGQAKKLDAKFENEVLPDIEWLWGFNSDAMPNFRHDDAFAWLKKTFAAKYKKQGELVKSECFSTTTNFYASDKNVEAMKAFLSKTGKTPYENLLQGLAVKKMDDLMAFQAIKLTYQDKIEGAIEKMEKTEPGASVILPGNPFNGRIQDCHDCDHAAPQKIKYSKLSFLKKLKELKDKIIAGEDVYNNSMLLANGFYNITHYGNARVFYECKVLGEGHSDPFFIDSAFFKMLTSMDIASKYYGQALADAKTDEQKAKCYYMLAKCERNQWYNGNVFNNEDNRYSDGSMINLNAISNFKLLKQYSNTQYYKDVIKECGYFKSYAGK